MRKYSTLFLSGIVLTFFALGISACSKDEEPVKYNLTFSQSTLTAVESDATIEIEIELDKPAPEDIKVDFELSGTAFDNIRAEVNDEYTDFIIDGDYGEIEIKKGETSAVIKLIPLSDDQIENDETIELEITAADNTSVVFESADNLSVTLAQEDGVVISLEWPASNTANGFVDMDLFLRIGETTSTWDGILTGSIYRSFELSEFVFIPKAFTGNYFGLGYDNTTYGISYTYYDGTRTELNFTSTFIDLTDGILEPVANRQVFPGSYTTANLNKWAGTTYPTIITQTFRNVGGSFVEFSEISTPEAGSRLASNSKTNLLNLNLNKYTRIAISSSKILPKKYRDQL